MNVPKGIDIEGLSPEDKRAIRRTGFEAWLDSYQPPKKAKPLSKSDMPSYNRCALRSKCLKAVNRQAGYVMGKGLYCSPLCAAKAQSLKARGRAKYVKHCLADPHVYRV